MQFLQLVPKYPKGRLTVPCLMRIIKVNHCGQRTAELKEDHPLWQDFAHAAAALCRRAASAPARSSPPKEPSAFGLAIKGLPQLWLSYCKDPIGTTRKAVEKHDFLSGILMAAVTYIAVFFATLVYALRLDSHFPAVAWLGASLLMPVAGFGLTLLTTLVLTKVAKVPSDFKGMLASSGLGMTFPATLAAGSIVLLLVYPGLISLLGVASFAVWAVVTVGTLLQVYGVKLNLVTILLCVAFCIAGYYVVSGLRDWFLHACYSYDINDVLSGLGDLFG